MSSEKKKTLLTGIRASHDVHLGNFLGAMKPAVERQADYDCYLFVANYHGITTTPEPNELRRIVHSIAATWLAIGLDPKKTVLWRQSDVPEVLELAYFLSCVTSMGLLERAHSYKDAVAKAKVVKAGIFYYPVLMAADILLYDADLVPVGKDQAQHLEMTRDMATFLNEHYETNLKLPDALISNEVAIVPGIDGRKMSKSYQNGISLLGPESEVKKQIMSIKTDSKGLAEPKDAENCTVYQLYRLVAPKAKADEMKDRLEKGGYGYGDAKKALFEAFLEAFGPMRKSYEHWMSHRDDLEAVLQEGATRARQRAAKIMDRVRTAVGL